MRISETIRRYRSAMGQYRLIISANLYICQPLPLKPTPAEQNKNKKSFFGASQAEIACISSLTPITSPGSGQIYCSSRRTQLILLMQHTLRNVFLQLTTCTANTDWTPAKNLMKNVVNFSLKRVRSLDMMFLDCLACFILFSKNTFVICTLFSF